MTLSGARSWSSLTGAYCHGCTVGRGGAWNFGSSVGMPCVTSPSSAVPRPVGRLLPPPPPPKPPPPPPPRVALTRYVSPSSLNTARLSMTPYAIGLASSTSLLRSRLPTTCNRGGVELLTPFVKPLPIAHSPVLPLVI